jgi:hypothetical protein
MLQTMPLSAISRWNCSLAYRLGIYYASNQLFLDEMDQSRFPTGIPNVD